MSKCSVFSTWKSKVRYWTLLRPKFWAEAGELGSSAAQHRRITRSPRRNVVIDTSKPAVVQASHHGPGSECRPQARPVTAPSTGGVSPGEGKRRERLAGGHQQELAAVHQDRARRSPEHAGHLVFPEHAARVRVHAHQ